LPVLKFQTSYNYDLVKIYKLKFFGRLAVLYETGNMSAEYYEQTEVFLLK